MAKKSSGLGKGLDSLIPDFYDEDFDSNDAVSLEDMLDDGDNVEDIVEETSKNDESIEEDVDESDENVEETPSNGEDIVEDTSSSEEESIEETHSGDDEVEDTSNGEDVEESSENNEVEIDDTENIEIDVETPSSDIHSDESDEESIRDQKILENVAEVTEIVDKNPRITLWSSQSAAVFRYLRKTEPEFSISKEASRLIDEAVAKKYPEIWELFEDI